MKKYALLLLVMLYSISSYADSFVFCSDADKIYISPEQITITQEGIFIFAEDNSFQVSAIMQDGNGIFYLRPSIYWSCKKCNYGKNPAWSNYCRNCKKRYNE